MLRLIPFVVLFLLVGCSSDDTDKIESVTAVTTLKTDETIVFFRTAGWLDETTQEWNLPVHGWVYEPQDSAARKALLETTLTEHFGLEISTETEVNLSRRLNLLVADNERGKNIVIKLAGRIVELPPSVENGHFETILRIPASEIDAFAKEGRLPYSTVTAKSEKRSFAGEVQLLAPAGLSVISDIDDTVKISNVTDHKRLLESTFLLDFETAPGMLERYTHWAAHDASFHFVSSSPWQLYSPLREFLDDSGFPWATYSLKAVRFRDETLLDLFKKGTETKPLIIKGILDRYPGRTFILVGDSGEQDPEVYAALLREYPQQVFEAYIRNVTQARADDERFTAVFDGIEPERWHLFDDPADPQH